MSRLSRLGIGIALCLFCVICFGVGYVAFIGTAISKDSVPGASVFDGKFIVVYVVFGGLILGALWFALINFKSAFAAPQRPGRPEAAQDPEPRPASGATPEERLAHLVKQPSDKAT